GAGRVPCQEAAGGRDHGDVPDHGPAVGGVAGWGDRDCGGPDVLPRLRARSGHRVLPFSPRGVVLVVNSRPAHGGGQGWGNLPKATFVDCSHPATAPTPNPSPVPGEGRTKVAAARTEGFCGKRSFDDGFACSG